MKNTVHLGKPRPIIDGEEKVRGRARYPADQHLHGMLHARLVLSPYPHARIRGIQTAGAEALPGVTVLTGRELNRGRAAHSRPSMLLADGEVMFAGQPVALVLAESEAVAADAAALLEVDYEARPSVNDAGQALQDDLLVWPGGVPKPDLDLASLHGAQAGTQEQRAPSNIDDRKTFGRGDAQAALAAAFRVAEGTYTTAWVHQGYLEPHAVVAEPGARPGSVTVYTSTQGQYVVRREVTGALGLRERDVLVQPMTVGGGFGAKYGILDSLVAAAALHVGRPVRLVLSRSEDMQTTMPAPGTQVRVRLGADQTGKLVGLDMQIVVENGVFAFGQSGIMAFVGGGMYRCENVRIETLEVLTHRLPTGAYRAPGVAQVLFALESAVDDLARALGRDPLEFRLQNAVESGDPSGVGRPWPDIGLKACLERARTHPLWQARGQQAHTGVGLAIGGWPGAFAPAGAVCRLDADGTVRLHVGSVDISGVHSSMVLIAAETLGVSPESVQIVQGNTDSGPFAPNSGGSQVTISLSGAVLDASQQVAAQVRDLAAKHFEAHQDDIELAGGEARVRGAPGQSVPLGQLARRAQSQPGGPGPVVAEGRAALKAGAPGFIVHLVQARVDPDTGAVKLVQAAAIQDVGFALNPLLVEGQMHGGTAQALGMGLLEGLDFEEGQLLNPNFLGYAFPTATDLPPLDAVIVEEASVNGPYGARVVGEPPITAGAAALANAILDASGVRVTALPITPEALWKQLRARAS